MTISRTQDRTDGPTPRRSRGGRGVGLSERLLLLTVAFVLTAEALIYVPSLANFRNQWLRARVQSAELALLAMKAASPDLDPALEMTLLDGAGVIGVEMLGGERPMRLGAAPRPHAETDLRRLDVWRSMGQALHALRNRDGHVLAVIDASSATPADFIRVLVDERDLSFAMRDYSHNILWLSGLISLLTGLLVFVTCRLMFVRPVERIAERLLAFRDDPECAETFPTPKGGGEVAEAEWALADMQAEVRRALDQRKRLVRLGESVAKINHDLRNILTSAQLVTDRLQASQDPAVRKLAPRLINAVDRAIELCGQTLAYTGPGEPEPVRRPTDLRAVAHDALETAGFGEKGPFAMAFDPSTEMMVNADPNHLFRIILNLARNSLQAMQRHGRNRGEVRIGADRQDGGAVTIDVADDGPGVPDHVRDELFRPFTRNASGSGLGLSIARQLARQHGGDVSLLHSTPEGATFRILIAEAAPS